MEMSRERTIDFLAIVPVILFYGIAVIGLLIQSSRLIASGGDLLMLVLAVSTKLAGAFFLAQQIVLFLIRPLPIAKCRGWLPRAAAVFGADIGMSLVFLPAAHLSLFAQFLSTLFTFAGTVASIYVTGILGRSFSVTPQARAFVERGPYRAIRHPLYVAEQAILFGVSLPYRQPWSFLIFLVSLAAQVPRMYFEERVLSQNIPAYQAYAARTARILPGLY